MAQLAEGRRGDLHTFAVFGERRKVTSSAKRRRRAGSLALAQTPDGSFRDLMANARDLLLHHCGFSAVPEVAPPRRPPECLPVAVPAPPHQRWLPKTAMCRCGVRQAGPVVLAGVTGLRRGRGGAAGGPRGGLPGRGPGVHLPVPPSAGAPVGRHRPEGAPPPPCACACAAERAAAMRAPTCCHPGGLGLLRQGPLL